MAKSTADSSLLWDHKEITVYTARLESYDLTVHITS